MLVAPLGGFPQGMSVPREFSSLAGAEGPGNKPVLSPDALLRSVATAREAIRSHPQSAEAYLALAEALTNGEEVESASAALDRALELNPRLAVAWYGKGLQAAREKNWPSAIESFQHALDAGYVPARLELAEMLLRIGDFTRAARELESVIRLEPKQAGAHYGLGLVRMQEGNFDAAEASFRQAMALRPQYADAEEGLGEVLLNRQAWPEAANVFERVLTERPSSTGAINGLATALSRIGRQEEARKEFARAQQLARRSVQLHRAQGSYNRGLELWRAGDLAGAAAAFRNALAGRADYAEAHNNLGGVLWEQNDFAGATAEFEAAVNCQPDYAEARNNLGNALVRAGDVDRGIQQFRAALAARPGFASAHFNLGMALQRKAAWAEAEEELRRAIVLAPDHAVTHIELGLLVASRLGGLSDEARAELNEGLRLDGGLKKLIPDQILRSLH